MDLISLIPQFGNLAFTIAAFVGAIVVIVFVHEFGHYIVGRWCGIRAEVFSLGFGPVLWARHDKHGTKWQLAAIPFGGFVKFFGDSNAASGKDTEVASSLSEEELRSTMHGAPLWARALTVAAGPFFNFALAVVVFVALAFSQGNVREPLTVGELLPLPHGTYDLRAGDEILAIEGTNIEKLADMAGLSDSLPLQETLIYTIRRNDRILDVTGPFTYPPLVNFLVPRSAAYDAGITVGDVIAEIDGEPIIAFRELKEAVETSGGKDLELTLWNDGDYRNVTLSPRRSDELQPDGSYITNWRIGVVLDFVFEPKTELLSVGEALEYGFSQVWGIIESSLSGIYHVIIGTISTCNLSGPIGIAETSGAMASQGIADYVYFIAFISSAVGLMNLLPVPVLDGGHLVFHLYESIAGRPPNDQVFRLLMSLGLAVLLSFMVFAVTNDVACIGG